MVLEVWKSSLMGIPTFVVTKIYLNETHAGFHEASGHDKRPSKAVLSVAFQYLLSLEPNIEGVTGGWVRDEAKRGGSVAIESGVGNRLGDRLRLTL
jgi:hypothetical protein